MKKIIFLLLIGSITTTLFAQKDEKDLNPKDPKAKAILDKMSEKHKSYSSITLQFEYKLENKAEGINETQNGKGVLKGNKYRLELGGQEVICNGKTVWTYLKDAKEVQIGEVVDDDEAANSFMNPKNFFSLYEKGFKYVKDKDVKTGNKEMFAIKLYPEKPGSKPFHTVMLYVDKMDYSLHSMEVKMKDGNLFTYLITSIEPNKVYAESHFNFITPKGVEEIDLR
jgi:outer membrane lipoprotein-sorting protein